MSFTIKEYNKLDSTNEEAARLYQSGKTVENTVIIAYEQKAGKGHNTNQWESEAGKNLTFSILLKPDFISPSEQFVLTQLVSLSIWEILDSILRKKVVKIKWPNDIYVGSKKIAGVLIQNFIVGNSIDLSILGIGLNVSQKKFTSDAPNPTSIILESGIDCPLDNLLDDILDTFEQKLESYKVDYNRDLLNKQYLDKLYIFNKEAYFEDINGIFKSTITGISDFGQLILTDKTGKKRNYDFKEIKFLDSPK